MHTKSPSASLAALLVALVASAPLAGALPVDTAWSGRTVGEIFVDAAGRASGANLATTIDEADGVIEGFSNLALGTTVFDRIRIEGFSGAEKIAGAGSSSLTLRGSNAIVSLHDDLHSVLKVRTLSPTLVTYTLAPGLTATHADPGMITLTDPERGPIGAIVAYGSAGPDAKGEVLQVSGGEGRDAVLARTQKDSEILFLAGADPALLRALREGSLVSTFVTEFEGSDIRTSQVDTGAHATARTAASSAGGLSTSVASRASGAVLLAYDLAYETLPATSPGEIVLYLDGELAPRVSSASSVLAAAREGLAAYHAIVEDGRSRILASTSDFGAQGGEQRIAIGVSASASASVSTERQAQAESAGEDDARVYGGFEYHSNGKLTGQFLTGVLPDGRGELLSFTSLATLTEVFRSIQLDAQRGCAASASSAGACGGGANARFRTNGPDEMTIETANAELQLVDDVLATARLVAHAPSDATYTLAGGIRATARGAHLVQLDGPRGPAGALILHDPLGASTLAVDAAGTVLVHLVPGASVLYRGSPDQHESEDAVLRGLAEGAFAAQVLVGMQAGEVATRTYSYSDDVDARAQAQRAGILVDFLAGADDAPRAILVDARGAALAAKSSADVRVRVDGVEAIPVATPEEALEPALAPRAFVATSTDGALRIIVNTASVTDRLVSVAIESVVQEKAEHKARTDAFGAFRLYHDGTAVGDYVTLKADAALGAVSGVTLLATREPVFTSLVAGATPYVTVSGDGTSVLKLENREVRIELSDTTAGLARVLALAEADAALHLAPELRAHHRGEGVVEIVRDDGHHLGTLVLIGAGTLEARGEREVRGTLSKGSELVFRAHTGIESELSAAQRTMLSRAIAAGHVAGTVLLQTQASISADVHAAASSADGLATSAQEAFGELTSSVTATYGDLQVVTAATRSRVDVTVASAVDVGKTLVLSLDPDTIPGLAHGKASLRFDGDAMAQASSYSDVLDPTDDAGQAEYFVLAGDAGTGTLVLVSIPHFSVHTVTLEETKDHPNSLYMWATIVLGILVVIEAGLIARGHLKKNTLNHRRP